MKQASDTKKMDNESFKKFAQRLNLNCRDSSVEGSRQGAGTTGRDNNGRSVGGMSDLMPISEQEQMQFQNILSQTQHMKREKAIHLLNKLKDSQKDQAYFTSNV